MWWFSIQFCPRIIFNLKYMYFVYYSGQEVEVKNHCTLHQPDKVCRQNEVALITRGRGPFTFEIADDFR
jgi:hypothetical protein